MLTLKAVATFAFTAITLVACSAGSEGTEATSSTGSALSANSAGGGIKAFCTTDANCNRGLVCDPICPNIPGRGHCEIAGGTCEPICLLGESKLDGSTFTSADGAHTITFTSSTAFTQKDSCPLTSFHCENIKLTVGTYTSNGTTVTLLSNLGGRNTMSVEPHCYQGLIDNSDQVDLYPVAAPAN